MGVQASHRPRHGPHCCLQNVDVVDHGLAHHASRHAHPGVGHQGFIHHLSLVGRQLFGIVDAFYTRIGGQDDGGSNDRAG